MRCLSVRQPWATLLVSGAKRCETRDWPLHCRGPLAIHAAKRWDADSAWLSTQPPFRAALERAGVRFTPNTAEAAQKGWHDIPFGAIVGAVNVVGCYRTEDVSFDYSGLDATPDDPVDQYATGKLRLWHEQKEFGDFGPDRFAFLCDKFVRLEEAIPFRGRLGLFDVPDELIPALVGLGK